MKTILIPMVNYGGMRSALETALLLARRFDSYMEGYALRSWIDPLAIAAGSIPPSKNTCDSIEDVTQAQTIFNSFMQENHVPRSSKTALQSLSYGWLNEVPAGDSFIGSYGRVFDTIIMNKLDSNLTGLYARAIESALIQSGRPLILSPASRPPQIGSNALIVWAGSAEQARAVAFAMPLLRQANQVTVLTIQGEAVALSPSAERLVQYLKCNGVGVDLQNVRPDGRNIGRVILTKAESLGCDLLINGVHRQNLLQRLIPGDATRYILTNATIPVLLAN